MALKYLLAIAFFAAVANAQTTPGIVACLGGQTAPLSTVVTGCTQAPCDVTQGTSAEMFIDFTAVGTHSVLYASVQATALGITGPYTLPTDISAVCQNLQGASCPLNSGEEATHHFLFPVANIYPPIPVTVELTVTDQASVTVFCVRIPIHVRLS